MDNVMLLVFVLACLALPILLLGLIRPAWLRMVNRKQASKWFFSTLLVALLSPVIAFMFAPPSEKTVVADPKEEASRVQTIQSELLATKTAAEQSKRELEQAKADVTAAKSELEKLKAASSVVSNADQASQLSTIKTELEQAKIEAINAKAELEKLKNEGSTQQTAQLSAVEVELEQAKTEDTTAKAELESFPVTDPACQLTGKVVSVADGDTVTVLTADKVQHKIRLAGVDAPEKAQPYGNAAKKYLSELVAKQEVCIQGDKTDKYQRRVAKVIKDGKDIDLEMIKAGYAWHYKKYASEQSSEDQSLYASAHDKAKSDVIGLWQEPDPIEPDAWRAGERPKSKQALADLPTGSETPNNTNQLVSSVSNEDTGASCGSKRFCKHMSSCAEACHYLNDCGLSRLDRDGDGVPCESICGRRCP